MVGQKGSSNDDVTVAMRSSHDEQALAQRDQDWTRGGKLRRGWDGGMGEEACGFVLSVMPNKLTRSAIARLNEHTDSPLRIASLTTSPLGSLHSQYTSEPESFGDLKAPSEPLAEAPESSIRKSTSHALSSRPSYLCPGRGKEQSTSCGAPTCPAHPKPFT
jgi:hypothetical protein